MVEVIVAIGTCLVLGYGARLALAGELSAGVLIVFLMYLDKMYKPMRDLSKMTDTVSKAVVGYERIQEVPASRARPRRPDARQAPQSTRQIEFDHVSFSYDGTRRPQGRQPPDRGRARWRRSSDRPGRASRRW